MGIVYSTGIGAMCPGCRRPRAQCVCSGAKGKGHQGDARMVRVSRQTQGRSGKGVTRITGLPLGPAELAALAAELKRRCASGGTVRGESIEIQGEHRDTLVAELIRRGFAARRAGG